MKGICLVAWNVFNFFVRFDCDNQSVINISSDPVQKQLTKHIEVRVPYIREPVHSKVISLNYFPTEENIADIFSKSWE